MILNQGMEATVLFSGLTPGFVGLFQVNVLLPGNIPSGNLAFEIGIDRVGPGNTVRLAVQ